jgi:hypothetical protein
MSSFATDLTIMRYLPMRFLWRCRAAPILSAPRTPPPADPAFTVPPAMAARLSQQTHARHTISISTGAYHRRRGRRVRRANCITRSRRLIARPLIENVRCANVGGGPNGIRWVLHRRSARNGESRLASRAWVGRVYIGQSPRRPRRAPLPFRFAIFLQRCPCYIHLYFGGAGMTAAASSNLNRPRLRRHI